MDIAIRSTSKLAIALILAATFLVGCGRSGPSGINGEVTVAGKPVAAGKITIIDVESNLVHQAAIESGKYSVTRGVSPATYLVRIEVHDATGNKTKEVKVEKTLEPNQSAWNFAVE